MEAVEINSVRYDMMRLWKDVFGDSDEYIDLIFKTYFDDSLFLRRYDSEKLISQLCCIPYCFDASDYIEDSKCVCLNNNKRKNVFKGGYLCGLATLPEYRKRGLMSLLIKESNSCLFNNNYALSFLIPASDELRLYYNKFGYRNIAFCTEILYSCNSDKTYSIDEDIKGGAFNFSSVYKDEKYVIADVNSSVCMSNNAIIIDDEILLKDVYSYFEKAVKNIAGIKIRHSFDDFIAIIHESLISKGRIIFVKDANHKPLGLLFCSNIIEGEATVQLVLAESEDSANVLLHFMKYFLPDNVNLLVRKYDGAILNSAPCHIAESDASSEENGRVDFRIQPLPDSNSEVVGRRKSFAMARILNVAEILKFAVSMYPSSEFSILINKDDFPKNEGFYEVCDAKVRFTPRSEMTDELMAEAERRCDSDPRCFWLSVADLATLLWRDSERPSDVPDRLEKCLDVIPCCPLNVFLMLE